MSENMSRRDAVRAFGAAVAGVAAGSTLTPAQVAALNKVVPAVPDLTGKTLVLEVKERSILYAMVLAGCSFEMQAGRLFLSGTNVPSLPDSRNWTDGVRRLVAWEAVNSYMVFASVEDYHSRLQTKENPATQS